MKTLKRFSMIALMALFATAISCGEDDDPQKQEDDTENPVVSITKPADGSTVSTLDATTSITIQYQVSDDTELASVTVDFNGTQAAEVTSFVDFRNYQGEQVVSGVSDGNYTITVTATDKAGNTASATSTFTKATTVPYEPMANEVLYMAFDGNFVESVSEVEATVVGSPGFAGAGKVGADAYAGATGGYLSIPATDIAAAEMTVSLYMKVNATPDRAGVLTMSPEDKENAEYPNVQNLRTSGFRFFREARGDNQIFKLNFGTGDSDVWLDGGDLATVDPTADEWHHFAFVIAATKAALYIDGALVAKNDDHIGMSLAGCDLLTIMSGVPRFTEWNHQSDLSYLDDLKIFNKAMTEAELTDLVGIQFGEPEFNPDPGLTPVDGADAEELLYMSFDTDFSVTGLSVTTTTVGTPTVVDGGVSGKAYKGAVDSYLTLPADQLTNTEFSASFWIKVNNSPDRAGLLVLGPEDTQNADYPNVQNLRTSGFRFFRENASGDQRFKLNTGNGTADEWADGGEYADIPGDVTEWRHVAITMSATKSQVYLNGILVTSKDLTGLDWTGCDLLSIGSGAPRFTEWGHKSDESMIDELRIYKGVLNPAQIASLKSIGN